ncbi:hypothetical protein ThvES_00000640 [Thiovulum sp. ES]|nr:hypothetical protein ThvES_00000640 [Thiovulum sp. ES]
MLKKTFLILPFFLFSGCLAEFMGENPEPQKTEEVKKEEPKVEKIHDYSIKASSQSETSVVSKPLPQKPETPAEKKELDEIEAMIKGEL